MERKNGYLIIDDFPKELANEDERQYFVYINGEEWYFKPTSDEEYAYNELVACHIARFLRVECCYYDLASLDGVQGVISKSFRKKDVSLVPGEVILGDYLLVARDTLVNLGLDELDADIIVENYHKNGVYEGIDIFNTLEALDLALRDKYEDKFDVDKVFVQIKKMLIFDILVNQSDRHSGNYYFIISLFEIILAPIFDNVYAFRESGHETSLFVCFEDRYATSAKVLMTFLEKYSHDDFVMVLKMFDAYVTHFSEAILMVEKQIGRELPETYKGKLFAQFKEHIGVLANVIRDYSYKTIKISGVSKKKYSTKNRVVNTGNKPLFKNIRINC